MRSENYALENLRDQIKQLERELEMAEQNKEMFYRLFLKWANEYYVIERAIDRINEEMKRHPH